ncbi:MAG: hypothetical protein IJV69_07340 [Kiritimatiellae bacterium]|nr:hypothetical protein [Kiritimatiellia bacterium]
MGFESGSMTFHAFYLVKTFTPPDMELFAKRVLPPISTLVGEQPLHGWAGPSHALDAELTEEHCWRGDWLWFAHVTAQKKVPPSLLRASLLAELEIERKARGWETLPRAARQEVKERVTEELLQGAQPSFGSMECAIDLRRERLLAGAMNDASMQVLCPFFRETTGCMPVLCGPESAALRLRGVDSNSVELINFTPNEAVGVPPEVRLGTEFLTWLFYRWEKENATFELDGERCQMMFEGPLMFSGDDAPGCHETVLRNGTPLDTPEFGIALWNGKKLRRAKLTLTRNDWIVSATIDGYDFAFRSLKCDPPKKSKEADAFSEMPSMNAPGAPAIEADTGDAKRKLTADERLDRAAFYVDAFLALYNQFLQLREDGVKWRSELAKIQPWIRERSGQTEA